MYGEERFRNSLERFARAGASAQGVVDGVLEDLDAFRADRPLDDDITCLVMKVL
jgi:serine phosphatase RsbU (regulator of sigma subunit)